MIDLDLSMFGFEALWSPFFFLAVAMFVCVYFYTITMLRRKKNLGNKVALRLQIRFVLGATLLYLLLGGPVDLLGHLLFSIHMMQMAGMYLVVVPLLLLGIPDWLFRLLGFHRLVKAPWGNPLLSLMMFNMLFSLYHLPIVFDTIKTNEFLHVAAHLVLFFTAIFMWWPLLNPLPEVQRLSSLKKIGYIFANGMLLTPACALIIFSHEALYTTYTNPNAWAMAMQLCVPVDLLQTLGVDNPYLFTTMTPLEDQQLGGVLMKMIQEIVYGVFIGYVFYHWIREERGKEADIINPYQIQK